MLRKVGFGNFLATLLNSYLLMRCLLGCVVFYLNLEESQSRNYILEKNVLGSVGKDMIPNKSNDMHPEGIIIIFMLALVVLPYLSKKKIIIIFMLFGWITHYHPLSCAALSFCLFLGIFWRSL
jgi:hypothetical protein